MTCCQAVVNAHRHYRTVHYTKHWIHGSFDKAALPLASACSSLTLIMSGTGLVPVPIPAQLQRPNLAVR